MTNGTGTFIKHSEIHGNFELLFKKTHYSRLLTKRTFIKHRNYLSSFEFLFKYTSSRMIVVSESFSILLIEFLVCFHFLNAAVE